MDMDIVDLIRLGMLAHKEFNIQNGFTIQVFPSNVGAYVIVAKPEYPKDGGAKRMALDKVEMTAKFFGFRDVVIRAGYSRTHNILCLSQITE